MVPENFGDRVCSNRSGITQSVHQSLSADSWRTIGFALFDYRFDGEKERSLMAICLPASQTSSIFSLSHEENRLKLASISETPAISVAPIRATRDKIYDLLLLKPDNRLVIFTHGLRELPISVQLDGLPNSKDKCVMEIDNEVRRGTNSSTVVHRRMVSINDPVRASVTLVYDDGFKSRACFNFVPEDFLTLQALRCLTAPLPAEYFFDLHRTFLELWSAQAFRTSDCVEFQCFVAALFKVLNLEENTKLSGTRTQWELLPTSGSKARFRDDPALRRLRFPPSVHSPMPSASRPPHKHLASVLYALHLLGEDLRLQLHRFHSLLILAPLICRIALEVRPEWSDYWKRLCPEASPAWPSIVTASACCDCQSRKYC